MLLEIDEVAVDIDEWVAAIARDDEEAITSLRKKLHGMRLYCHALSETPHEKLVALPLKHLHEHNVIRSVVVLTYEGDERYTMPWIGCGACDRAFVCYDGETRCHRLADTQETTPCPTCGYPDCACPPVDTP